MRTLTLCLAALLSLSLFACGESESKPAGPAKATPAVVPPAPATQPSEPETDATTQTSELAPPTNTKCPVTGEEVDPKDRKLTVVDYKGKSYGLCCKDCIDEFNKHPEKYVAK